MILHVVLFEPKSDLPAANKGALVASIERAARTIPSVRRFEVGPRLADGPAYQQGTGDVFSFVAVIGFDDRAGLQAYLEHPAHAALGRLFNETLARALVYDYEVRDARSGLGDSLAE